jgi:coenzyme F420-reducing hydrogenase beta subunit
VDAFGRIQAVRIGRPSSAASAEQMPALIDAESVCPFSRTAADEDAIGRRLFAGDANFIPKIGFSSGLYAGYVVEGDYRVTGSSGGMGSWIAAELLRRGMVDAVLHVKPARDPAAGLLFDFQVSRTVDEVRAGGKSRYYPCELSGVMRQVRETPGRYALIALPCFSKAARQLAAQDAVIAERLRFVIALVCGHLKSTAYARMYAWQAGMSPEDLRYIDFRHKGPGLTAKHYFIELVGEHAGERARSVIDNKAFFGTDWGHGFFKYQACDYCDDVLGETADLTIGDAWLEKYDRDPGGTNVIIIRNRVLAPILKAAAAEGRIWIEPLSAEEIIRSQAGGFRHRHDGLAYRLARKDRAGIWRPPKRIAAGRSHLTMRNRCLFRLREVLRDESHRAFLAAVKKGDLSHFVRRMKLLLLVYSVVYRYTGLMFWKKRLLRGMRSLAVHRLTRF